MKSIDDGGLRRVHPSARTLASGAWFLGGHPGQRRFVALPGDWPGGHRGRQHDHRRRRAGLRDVGRRRATASNAVVLVCHASHRRQPRRRALSVEGHLGACAGGRLSSGPGGPSTPTAGTSCASTSSAGARASTGPASAPTPTMAGRGAQRFLVVTVRDMVRVPEGAVADHLEGRWWASVIGGSMGRHAGPGVGRHVPRAGAARCVPIATRLRPPPPQQIGWWFDWAAGSSASTLGGGAATTTTPTPGEWARRGPGPGPPGSARSTFRSVDVFTDRFGRDFVELISGGFELRQRFEVERYLEYHGDKLVRRWDANSYLHLLTKAMDLHDLGAGAGRIPAAMGPASAGRFCAMGRVPATCCTRPYQSKEIAEGGPGRRADRPSTPRSTVAHGSRRLPHRDRPGTRLPRSSSPGSSAAVTEPHARSTAVTAGRRFSGQIGSLAPCCSRRRPTRSIRSTTTGAGATARRRTTTRGSDRRRPGSSRTPSPSWRGRGRAVFASGMGAVTATVLGLCSQGD